MSVSLSNNRSKKTEPLLNYERSATFSNTPPTYKTVNHLRDCGYSAVKNTERNSLSRVLGGKLLSAFSTPSRQDGPSMTVRHSFSKPEFVLSLSSTGLVGPFHFMPL